MSNETVTRRDFLKAAGAFFVGALAAGCGLQEPEPQVPVTGNEGKFPTLIPFKETSTPTQVSTQTPEATPSLYPEEVTTLAESLGLDIVPRTDPNGGWDLVDPEDGSNSGIRIRKDMEIWLDEIGDTVVKIQPDDPQLQLIRSEEGRLEAIDPNTQEVKYFVPLNEKAKKEFVYYFSASSSITQEELNKLAAEKRILAEFSLETKLGHYYSARDVIPTAYRIERDPNGKVNLWMLISNTKGESLLINPKGFSSDVFGEMIIIYDDPHYDYKLYPFNSEKTQYFLNEMLNILREHKPLQLIANDVPNSHEYSSPEEVHQTIGNAFAQVDIGSLNGEWWLDDKLPRIKDPRYLYLGISGALN